MSLESAEDSPPPRPEAPVVTYCILAVITAIYAAMAVAGHGDVTRAEIQFGAKQNALIMAGQYWRFITPIFLHGSWVHLLGNGLSLYLLGGPMEQIYGRRKYFALFLFAGIAGNVLSFFLSPRDSVGASGALSGLVGAGLVFPIRFRDLVPPEARKSIVTQLAWIVALNLGLGFWLRGIVDNWAHLGGFIGGALLALFLIPDVLDSDQKTVGSRVAANTMTVTCVGLVLASWYMQWRWAKLNPPSRPLELVSYFPGAGPQWWSIELPKQWRFAKGTWRSPDGANISVEDLVLADIAARPDLQAMLARHVPFNTEVDGRFGWYTATKTRAQYRIPIYDRIFELTLTCDGKPLTPNAVRDFMIAASTVRFIRPPFTAPVVVKPQQPAPTAHP